MRLLAPPRAHRPARSRRSTTPLRVLVATTALLAGLAAATSPTAPTASGAAPDTPVTASRAVEVSAPREARRGWPTEETVGVPRGWSPRRTYERDVHVRRDNAVVRDVRIIGGDLLIEADNVTVERVELVGGRINNLPYDTCYSDTVIKHTTIRRGSQTSDQDLPVIGDGGYTARGVAILDVAEGFRVSGSSDPYNCGPVRIVNSYARVMYPDVCDDWHGDALQGYDGNRLTVRNSVFTMVDRPDCGGTAPFFYPKDQGNTSVDIDGMLVRGGGYPFRNGMPGTVRNLEIVQESWAYGPIDVQCSVISEWDAHIVKVVSQGTRTRELRRQRCNTEGGN